MAAELKPYLAYRDSGVPWLGEVPAHWHIKRGKALFRCIDVRSSTGAEELLTVSSERGVVPRSSTTVTMFKAESYVGYKLCWPGDLVVNSLWAWGRGLGVSRYHGIVSSAYGVYRLRGSYSNYAGYIDKLVRSIPFNWELQVRSKGIWISRLQLTDEAFLGAPFPLPPVDEQAEIVRFLDRADRRIRRYIRAKEKLIALLEEQKLAMVHEAVTGKIDVRTGRPYAAYKPSGFEWLGKVPRHWEISRVKTEFRCLNDRRVPVSGTERGVRSVGRYDYYGASGVIDKVDDYLFDDELLLLAEDGANLVLRSSPLVVIARGRFWVNNHAHVLKPKRGNLEYLAALMEGLSYSPWISGAAQPKLTQDRLMSIAIAVPPRREQDRIASLATAATGPLSSAIARTRREIGLVRDYQGRLIADAVEGKIDVRRTAASLLDEDVVGADECEAAEGELTADGR